MDDDFNTPQALGVLFDLGTALYERLDAARTEASARAGLLAGAEELRRLGGALGLFQVGTQMSGPPEEIERLVVERTAARQRRDWRRSDELRVEIEGRGWQIEDTPTGPRVTRRRG
jgi:cysteinyl-tRNA synthetase